MRYVSTRGQTPPMAFTDAVLTGLAPDGGLLLPAEIPRLHDRIDALRDLDFVELATTIVSAYVDDIPPRTLARLVRDSYSSFDHPDITPLVQVGELQLLELFHGPTLAFKDIALQLLGNLFAHILGERHDYLNILGATSGDTGSAGIAGVRGKPGIDIFVLYPHGRTSKLQEMQMACVDEPNVHAIAIEGSFDDCQRIMKSIFSDLQFKAEHHLGAINSVNWARVLAQIVYYFHAALRMPGPATFSVPTGNFGDVFAGYLAWRMGAPIDKLVVATNCNDILARFFDSGVYQRGAVHHTISPSMDIQVASNFERYIYYLMGEDASAVRQFMSDFAGSGRAEITGATDSGIFVAASVDEDATLATIGEVWREHGYLLDPHTAVGVAAARQLRTGPRTVCLATAHPAKFPQAIQRATGADLASHPRLDALAGKPLVRTLMPADEDAVKAFIVSHANSTPPAASC